MKKTLFLSLALFSLGTMLRAEASTVTYGWSSTNGCPITIDGETPSDVTFTDGGTWNRTTTDPANCVKYTDVQGNDWNKTGSYEFTFTDERTSIDALWVTTTGNKRIYIAGDQLSKVGNVYVQGLHLVVGYNDSSRGSISSNLFLGEGNWTEANSVHNLSTLRCNVDTTISGKVTLITDETVQISAYNGKDITFNGAVTGKSLSIGADNANTAITFGTVELERLSIGSMISKSNNVVTTAAQGRGITLNLAGTSGIKHLSMYSGSTLHRTDNAGFYFESMQGSATLNNDDYTKISVGCGLQENYSPADKELYIAEVGGEERLSLNVATSLGTLTSLNLKGKVDLTLTQYTADTSSSSTYYLSDGATLTYAQQLWRNGGTWSLQKAEGASSGGTVTIKNLLLNSSDQHSRNCALTVGEGIDLRINGAADSTSSGLVIWGQGTHTMNVNGSLTVDNAIRVKNPGETTINVGTKGVMTFGSGFQMIAASGSPYQNTKFMILNVDGTLKLGSATTPDTYANVAEVNLRHGAKLEGTQSATAVRIANLNIADNARVSIEKITFSNYGDLKIKSGQSVSLTDVNHDGLWYGGGAVISGTSEASTELSLFGKTWTVSGGSVTHNGAAQGTNQAKTLNAQLSGVAFSNVEGKSTTLSNAANQLTSLTAGGKVAISAQLSVTGTSMVGKQGEISVEAESVSLNSVDGSGQVTTRNNTDFALTDTFTGSLKASAGTMRVTNATSLNILSAVGGQLHVTAAANGVTVKHLEIASGSQVTAVSGVAVQSEEATPVAATITLSNGELTVASSDGDEGDAVLNADLLLGATTISLNSTLTLNGSLTLGRGNTLLLGESFAANADGSYTLFTGCILDLGEGWQNNTIDASAIFSRIGSNSDLSGYSISYNETTKTLNLMVVPEPTTATLSLLALAGLAARRRR